MPEPRSSRPASSSDLLARIDERTQQIKDDVAGIQADLRSRYVSIDRFRPVELLVYAQAGILLAAMLSAFVYAVWPR